MERERKIQAATLAIKKKYGKNAILKAMTLEEGATAKMCIRDRPNTSHTSNTMLLCRTRNYLSYLIVDIGVRVDRGVGVGGTPELLENEARLGGGTCSRARCV